MHRLSLLLVVLLAPLHAQAPDEGRFLGEAAKRLNAFATMCFKSHYPRRAKEVWLEIIAEYDTNDAVARKALGFVRVGTSWAPDPSFTYPDQDQPDAAVALQLNKRWNSLIAELGKEHLDLAEQLGAAGNSERANYHRQRAARFAPSDKKISAALGLKSEGGVVGSSADLTLLKRTRLLEKEVTVQLAREPKVEQVKEFSHPYLQAGPPLLAFRGENYTVVGDWDAQTLAEATKHAERALAFSKIAFAGYEGFPKELGIRTFVFYKSRDTWRQVLTANKGLFSGDALAFILEYTSATTMGGADKAVRIAGVEDDATLYDLAVRWVAQQQSGCRTDGMVEGIGHAIVGMFFGRNLIYTVGRHQPGRGTAAGGGQKKRILLPDLTSWAEMAVESAWQRTSVPAADLPLVKAAEFTEEARIKSWSFCDYLLRRDPTLMLHLDRTAGSGAKTQPQVSAKFAERTKGLQLELLDEDWRRFWTEDTPIMRAIRNKKAPLEGVSVAVPEWLEEFNKLRQNLPAGKRPMVGWSEAWSTECRQHVEYLKANGKERGPEREHTQDLKLKGATNGGRTFARQALVAVGQKDAKKALAKWLDWPGYRDAVLNPNIDTIGLYVDAGIMVMDVSRGVLDTGTSTSVHYPFGNQQGVPVQIEVAELGPEVAALLAREGKKGLKVLGYPITFHGFRGSPKSMADVRCEIMVGKDQVEGILHIASDGVRRACAPGLIVFYPLQPLKRGMLHKVTWAGVGDRAIEFQFTTQ